MKIESIETRLYYIPLPEVLSDSTRGEMRYFGLVTVEVRATGARKVSARPTRWARPVRQPSGQ